MQLGFLRLTPAVRTLLFVTTGVWLLDLVTALVLGVHGSVFNPYIGLFPTAVLHFQLWRPVTYMFAHAGFLHLFFNMLALWMFGIWVEDALGSRRFYQLYFISGLAGAATAMAAYFLGYGAAVVGASGATLGVTIAFCMLFSEETVYFDFLIPIKARYLGWLVVIMEVLPGLAGGNGRVSFATHLGGALAGFLVVRYKLYWDPPRKKPRKSRSSARLRVVPDAGRKVVPVPKPEVELSATEKEVDRILDKLSKEGMDALSPAERKTLDAHSTRLRERDGG